jgi:alpha-ribazole phosphatase
MEVYLIRHTTPDPEFSKGICYGQSDIPLADTFHTERNELIKTLSEPFDVVYSSPMRRCNRLAQFIKTRKSLIMDERLLEMNFGDWEMKAWDEINQTTLKEWMEDFVNVSIPNGESFIKLNNRVNTFIDELIAQKHERVAIVTHAGVIRCFMARVLEKPLKNAFELSYDYSSVNILNIE